VEGSAATRQRLQDGPRRRSSTQWSLDSHVRTEQFGEMQYLKENTTHLHDIDQLVTLFRDVVAVYSRESYETHKYTLCAKCMDYYC
jgi:hypothetical protein